MKTLEYKDDAKYLNSSRDKEVDGTQFLQIGITMTKLSLYKHKIFMKCVFCTKFYNGFISKISACTIMPVFTNRVIYALLLPIKEMEVTNYPTTQSLHDHNVT